MLYLPNGFADHSSLTTSWKQEAPASRSRQRRRVGRGSSLHEETDSEHLDYVDDSLDRMETIIDETLALAREGQTIADPEPVDVTAVAERSWDGVETQRGSLQIEDSLWVEADPDRLQQVFENFFRNAVEHAAADGVISESGIRCESDDSRVDSPSKTTALASIPRSARPCLIRVWRQTRGDSGSDSPSSTTSSVHTAGRSPQLKAATVVPASR